MEEKLDEVLKSIAAIKGTQKKNQGDIAAKLNRLERDIASDKEETLELVAKKLKREPELQLSRKGNEKQFTCNESVNDAIQSATSLLEKVKPTAAQDTVILKNAKEQLQEGTRAIAERQKHIRLVDRSDYGWQLVEAYQQADTLAENEKDTKNIEEAEKAVELKNRQKRKHAGTDGEKKEVQPLAGFCGPPQPMGNFHPHHLCHIRLSQCHSL